MTRFLFYYVTIKNNVGTEPFTCFVTKTRQIKIMLYIYIREEVR
nr:MAG TPA: hypothetical protein [Caudoviricetes sp.]